MKGFTLIELMIVVAIISILAAIAVPAWQDAVCKEDLNKCQIEMPVAFDRYQNRHNPEESKTDKEKIADLMTSIHELSKRHQEDTNNVTVITSQPKQQQTMVTESAPLNVETEYLFKRDTSQELVLKRHLADGYLYACQGKQCTKVKETK